MPVISERISEGIYSHRWIGHVTFEEVLEGLERERQFLSEDTIEKYVAIVDCSEIETIPLNIPKLLTIVTGNELLNLMYSVPPIGQKIGKIICSILQTPIEFTTDWEQTLTRAREAFAEYKVLKE